MRAEERVVGGIALKTMRGSAFYKDTFKSSRLQDGVEEKKEWKWELIAGVDFEGEMEKE